MTTRAVEQDARTADLRVLLRAGTAISERRIDAAGVATAVLECGRGEPMVLLHGPGEFAETWVEVIPALAATHRVVAPDLPGHGASGAGPSDLDVDGMLAWLDEVIGQTCDAPPIVVGRVLGGALAARFAIEHGDRMRQLVLVDTMGLAPFEPAPPFGEALHRFFAEPSEHTYDGLMQYCAFDIGALRSRLGDRWHSFASYAVDRAQAPGRLEAIGAVMELFAAPIREADLARIKVPTTLIWGRHDLATPLRAAEEAGRAFGWPLHIIEDAGDDPAIEQPEAFVEAVQTAISSGGRVR